MGKGTYATRIADTLGFCHIAAGDLVRDEIKQKTEIGRQMEAVVNAGQLLPDALIFQVLRKKFESVISQGGNTKFLLDGFPRTAPQAGALEDIADVQLALNLDLREEVLVEKCLGRRLCSKCGRNYNIADIYLPADPATNRPQIIMPPLNPPENCVKYMEQRSDDNEETVKRRIQVYKDSASPVEQFYREKGRLIDFEITGGIPETFPVLRKLLESKLSNNTSHAKAAEA